MRVAQNTDQDLVAVDTQTDETAELTAHQGEMQNVPAGWLQDGRMLAISDHDSDFLHLEAIDVHTGERELYDSTDWDVELATTSSNGQGVAWSVNEDGYSRLRWRSGTGTVSERETGGTVGDLVLSHDEMDDALNFRAVQSFAADALHGGGVFETLRGISEIVLKRLAAGSPAA